MMFLPRALSGISDGRNALNRLTELFHADVLPDHPIKIEAGLKFALQTSNATFEWEEVRKDDEGDKSGKDKKHKEKHKEKHKSKVEEGSGSVENEISDRRPFRVEDITMTVERGTVCAIAGPVGCGKVRLLPSSMLCVLKS